MVQLSLAGRVMRDAEVPQPRIADLETVTLKDGRPALVSVTRSSGELVLWSLEQESPQGLSRLDGRALPAGDTAGAVAGLVPVTLDIGPVLVFAGSHTGAMMRYRLDGDDRFASTSNLGAHGLPGDLVDAEAVRLPGGEVLLYGGIAGGAGLARLTLDPAKGTVTGSFVLTGEGMPSDGIAALAQVETGVGRVLYTLGDDLRIGGFNVSAQGDLTRIADLGPDDNLWIAAPTALEAVTVGDTSYLVVAAAGSSSLNAIRIGADGGLVVTDQVMDDLDTRFARVSAMQTASIDGRGYAVVAGADDGVTVFELLPNGRFLTVVTIAGAEFGNVSALALSVQGGGIDIFAATTAGDGDITRLRFDPGPAGVRLAAPAGGDSLSGGAGNDLLAGGPGNDTLKGGVGDDIILDGAGSDTMTGGAGADVFVLSYDGKEDRITDFEPGIDRLDLSAWPMLRGPGQLTFEETANGLRIAYRDEVLILESRDGGPIAPAALNLGDILGASHVTISFEMEESTDGGGTVPASEPPVTTPEPPSPPEPPVTIPKPPSPPEPPVTTPKPPSPPEPPVTTPTPLVTIEGSKITGGPDNDQLRGGAGDDEIRGGAGNDQIRAGAGNDQVWGGPGNDRIWGSAGDDQLRGEGGDDEIWGEAGNDQIWGGDGNDKLYGGQGDDQIRAGVGNDRVWGGPGNDRIWGSDGNDLLWGEDGNDQIWGENGNDRIWGGAGNDKLYGGQGDDRILGGLGNDQVWGGLGDDRIWGSDGDDLLWGEAGNDQIWGEAGNDQIWGGNGSDKLYGGQGNDQIRAGLGNDQVWGGPGNDRIWGSDGDDLLWGEDGDDEIWGETGNDQIWGGNGNDKLYGGQGNDQIRGGGGDDQIWGGPGDDQIWGDAGNDILYGEDGNDQIRGGEGNDILHGGPGDDILTGGAGADVFIFTAGRDVITDFRPADDRLTLDPALWPGNPGAAALVDRYATRTDAGVFFDFGHGDTLLLEHLLDPAVLVPLIDFL